MLSLGCRIQYTHLSEESYHINKVTFKRGKAGTVFNGVAKFDVTLPELKRKQAQLHHK